MSNSPSEMKESILEDFKSSLEFEELAKACYNKEFGESLARYVNDIHHIDPNFDFDKVPEIALFARFQ